MSLPVWSHVGSRGIRSQGVVSGAGRYGTTPPPVKIVTHTCENITFPQLRLWAVKIRWPYEGGSCCDMDQNDTIGKIELNPLSSCQVIILIARMTFNCSFSCLMS